MHQQERPFDAWMQGPLRLTRRRLLGLGALAGASLTALAACAGPPPAPATAPPAPAKAPEPTKPAVGAATATLPPQPTPAVAPKTPARQPVSMTIVTTGEGKDLRDNIQPFLDKNPDIRVEVIGVAWEGYDDKVDLLIAGGDPPAVWYSFGKHAHVYYLSKGLLAELDSYVQRDKYDLTDFHPTVMPYNYTRGKLYGLPVSNFPTVLAYNKDLTEKAGVTMPTTWTDLSWTWDKLVEYSKAMTTADADPMKRVFGFQGFGANPRFATLELGAPLFVKADYETLAPKKSRVTEPDMVAAFQFMQDLIWKYKVQPPPDQAAAFEQVTPSGRFLSGKAGMMRVLSNSLVDPLGKIKDFKWGVTPFPANKYSPIRSALYAGNWVMFKVRYQDQAWELLKYVVSPEAMRLELNLEKQNRNEGVTQGGIPARLSLLKEWISTAVQTTRLPESVLRDVIVAGQDHGQITYDWATPKFTEIWDLAMKPEVDKLLLNKTTVGNAVGVMDRKINEILAAS